MEEPTTGELWAQVAASDGVERADALTALGRRLLFAGELAEALAAASAAAGLYEAAGRVRELAGAHHNVSVVLRCLDRVAEAAVQHDEAWRRYREVGDSHNAAHCLRHAGDLYVDVPVPATALARFDLAGEVFEREGDPAAAASALLAGAKTALRAGKPGWARDRVRRARVLADPLGDVATIGGCELLTAHLLRRRKRPEAALAALRRASALLDAVGDDESCTEAALLRVELLADAGLAADALDLADALRAELRQASDAAAVARCDLAAGRALLKLGETEQAVPVLEAAATVFDAVGRGEEAELARRLAVTPGA